MRIKSSSEYIIEYIQYYYVMRKGLFVVLLLLFNYGFAQTFSVGAKETTISMPNGKKKATFKISNEALYRFTYKDSTTVFGDISLINTADKEQMLWVGELCVQAKNDANKHYKMHKASTAGVTALSVLNPIVGLALVLPVAKTTPRYENLGSPDMDILQDRIYYEAYSQEAKKMKAKRAWIGFGVGSVVSIGILTTVLLLVK